MVNVSPFNCSLIQARIANLIGKQRYDFWFAERVKVSVNRLELTVTAPNQHFVDLLASRYRAQLEAIAREFLGNDGSCRFRVAVEQKPLADPSNNFSQRPQSQESLSKSPSTKELPTTSLPRELTNGRTLDDFIISESNRMAVFSTRSFCESENGVGLLVLVGPPSRGKSHLLEGLKNLYQSTQQGVVKQLEGETFVSRFIDAIRKSKAAAFRRSLLECDLLVVDDLDKLEGKPSCQAEFLTILELAKQNEVKIAISMCHPPRQTTGLNRMLVERLQSGLLCSIGPLDPSGKAQLMKQFLEKLGVGLITEDFYQEAGNLLPESAREIEGIAQKVWLLGRLEARPVDLEILHLALHDHAHPACAQSIETITATVAGVLGISTEAILGRSKSPLLEMGRLFAYYLARKTGGHSSGEIGAYFHGRTHSTIINGANQITKRLASLNPTKRWPSNWKSLLNQVERLLDRKQ